MQNSAAEKPHSRADKEHSSSTTDPNPNPKPTTDQLSRSEKLDAQKRELDAWRVRLELERLAIVKVQNDEISQAS